MVRQSSSGTLRRVVVGYCLAVTEWPSRAGCVSESSGLAVPVRHRWFGAPRQVASSFGEFMQGSRGKSCPVGVC